MSFDRVNEHNSPKEKTGFIIQKVHNFEELKRSSISFRNIMNVASEKCIFGSMYLRKNNMFYVTEQTTYLDAKSAFRSSPLKFRNKKSRDICRLGEFNFFRDED